MKTNSVLSSKDTSRLQLALAFALISIAALCLRAYGADSDNLRLHITDFGIGQFWSENLRTGDTFSSAHNRLYPELNDQRGAQILIPMPPDRDLEGLSEFQLANQIAVALIEHVSQARPKGVTTFEIQLVEHISKAGYADDLGPLPDDRQEKVRKFAAAAYSAIGRLLANQQPAVNSIKVDATLGSNGTMAFTENVASWKSYRDHIDSVTLVDGRAFIDPTRETIKTLGPEKVRITNTYGDMPAHPWSIAMLSTNQKLQSEFPNLTVLLLEPMDPDKRWLGGVIPLSSHVLSIVKLDSEFVVRRAQDGQMENLGRYGAKDIRDMTGKLSNATGSKEGGVLMRIKVRPSSLEENQWEDLNKLKKSILQSRTNADTLTWPIRRKGEKLK